MLQTIDFKAENNSQEALVLLHGYGANAEDLAPLIPLLKQDNDCWGYVPQAPVVPPSMAAFGGRAWYDLDITLLEQRSSESDAPFLNDAHVKKLRKCVDTHILPFLENIAKDGTKICLGGFSQGSTLCLDVLLRHRPEYLKSVIMFSGAWPYPGAPTEDAADGAIACPVYVSHGVNDDIIPVKFSRKMVDELRKRNFEVTQNEFSGGHEIPQHILEQAVKFTSSTFFHK